MKNFKDWLESYKFKIQIGKHPEDDPEHIFSKDSSDDPENVLNNLPVDSEYPTKINKRQPINFSNQSTIIRKR